MRLQSRCAFSNASNLLKLEESSFGLGHVLLSCSKVLPAYFRACHEKPQPSVENPITFIRDAPLRIVLESLFYFIAGREVYAHRGSLVLNVCVLVSVPVEPLFELVWAVAKQNRSIERALHVVEPTEVLCFVLNYFGKLHRVEAKEKPVARHTLLNGA